MSEYNGIELEQEGLLILARLQCTGAFNDCAAPTVEMRDALRQARQWLQRVEQCVGVLPIEEVLNALAHYDLIHRVVYRKPNSGFLRQWHMSVVDARIKGNTAINDLYLFRAIDVALRQRDVAYLGRPLQWFSITLERWVKECMPTGAFRGLSVAETIDRTALLIGQDLRAFTSRQDELKHRLLNACTPLLDDMALLPADAKMALARLLQAMRFSRLTAVNVDSKECELYCLLATDTTLPHSTRQAYALLHEYRTTLHLAS